MTISRNLVSFCTVLLLAANSAFSFAAAPAKPKAETTKPTKKAVPASKLEAQLGKAFKLWDRNKDDAVDKDELDKALLPKTTGKKGAPAPDPKPMIDALYARLDSDKDGKVASAEFDGWAASFGTYLTESVKLQNERAGIEGELVKLQRLAAGSGNVTAGDGIFQQEANRGIIRYQIMLKEIDAKLAELAGKDGHSDYAQFLWQHLFK